MAGYLDRLEDLEPGATVRDVFTKLSENAQDIFMQFARAAGIELGREPAAGTVPTTDLHIESDSRVLQEGRPGQTHSVKAGVNIAGRSFGLVMHTALKQPSIPDPQHRCQRFPRRRRLS